MKECNACVVGAGPVGQEMIRLLRKRNFPAKSIVILARSAREEIIDGISYPAKKTPAEAFEKPVTLRKPREKYWPRPMAWNWRMTSTTRSIRCP